MSRVYIWRYRVISLVEINLEITSLVFAAVILIILLLFV